MRRRWQQLTLSFEAPPGEVPQLNEKRPNEEFFIYMPQMKLFEDPNTQLQKTFLFLYWSCQLSIATPSTLLEQWMYFMISSYLFYVLTQYFSCAVK